MERVRLIDSEEIPSITPNNIREVDAFFAQANYTLADYGWRDWNTGFNPSANAFNINYSRKIIVYDHRGNTVETVYIMPNREYDSTRKNKGGGLGAVVETPSDNGEYEELVKKYQQAACASENSQASNREHQTVWTDKYGYKYNTGDSEFFPDGPAPDDNCM